MSALPEITVAMSMHNASRFLRECIDSVLAQTFADFEFLIVDDGSTDGSADIVRSYADPRIRLVCRPHDFIASLNTLLTEARGRYIARMDADDVMMPDRLRIQYDYLEAHSEVAAVSAGAIKIDEAGNPIGRITTGDSCAPVAVEPRRMCEFNQVCNPASMIRRSVIDTLGLRYDPTFQVASDYRFWCDLLLSGAAIHLMPFDAIKYRISVGQISTSRSDESEASATRIRHDLTMQLVAAANPGYTRDPVIESSGHELTLIIPFLNEGDEVENTVRSFLDHGGAGRVDIIVINDCSYDSYPYMERLTAIPGVTYILNRERLGVAASRDKGVSLCRTPYFLLLDAHMRAYDDLWVTEIPRLLHENDRRILCCQTKFLICSNDGKIIPDPNATQSYGARMIFNDKQIMPGIEWISEERSSDHKHETIPCVLGAGYGCSRRYWIHLGGLNGLINYGYDEQMISLKAWMDGGECVLLKNCVLGHIYRKNMPYKIPEQTMLHNSIAITETLFPDKERCRARAVAFFTNKYIFLDTLLSLNLKKTSTPINTSTDTTIHSFNDVIRMNRIVTSLEKTIFADIMNRLPEIAAYVIDQNPQNTGIFDGSMGYAIWLLHYGFFSGDVAFTSIGKSLVNYSISNTKFEDLTFSTGITGIGWAMRYLSTLGFLDTNEEFIRLIDQSIIKSIISIPEIPTDISLSTGVTGLLAYCCSTSFPTEHNILTARLDHIASAVIDNAEATVTELFYAILWLHLHRTGLRLSVKAISLSDWVRPSVFIPQDKRFWTPSLYDGVLSASIICFKNY